MMRVRHSPERIRKGSELAHHAMGVGLGSIAMLAATEEWASASFGFLRWGWRVGILILGGLFVGYLLLHHGLRLLPVWLSDLSADPQQRQHLIMGGLLVAAGLCEVVRASGLSVAPAWGYAWPLALLTVAILFLVHPQHGTKEAQIASRRYHTMLGLTVGTGGVLAALEAVRPALPFGTLWALVLLAAAIMLVVYREPPGAWEGLHESNARSHWNATSRPRR